MSMSGSRLGLAMFNALQAYDKGKTPGDAQSRMVAIANEIVTEISTYATIAPLATTSTPADGPGHIHVPITILKTGGIS